VTREPKKAEPEVKRKAPITGRKYEEDLEDEEDVDMDDLDEDEFDEEDIEMGDGEADGEEKPSNGGSEGVDGEAAKRLSKGKPHLTSLTHFKPELIPQLLTLSRESRSTRPTTPPNHPPPLPPSPQGHPLTSMGRRTTSRFIERRTEQEDQGFVRGCQGTSEGGWARS